MPYKIIDDMSEKNIKEPVQKRSIATKNKLKKAARKLFAEKGFYQVTSIHIAKAASVPVGSFYNYFGNKKGILLALIREFNETFHEEIRSPLKRSGPVSTTVEEAKLNLRKSLQLIIESSYLNDPFYKIFHALQFTEPEVLKLSEEFRTIEINFLIEDLAHINQFYAIPNIPIKAKTIHALIENVNLYINHLDTTYEKEQLIEETALMINRYLFEE